ncbi:hypothetical protein [Stenotrophomonas sp. YIM B13575]|uniref:hypothetical protein n=1 Tax=Stenotrophomonas sp. YIM B13575 TaxID=3366314 RepID=UPI00367B191E
MQLRHALAIAALMVLAGCTQHLQRVPAQCDAMCFRPCVDAGEDTGVRVTADPAAADAWDNIGGDVVGQLADKLRTCDVRRKACEQCLRRLDAKNVIQL